MGIKALNEFLRKKGKEENISFEKTGSLYDLSGKRIAIDMGCVISVYLPVARKEIVNRHNLAKGPPPSDEIVNEAVYRILVHLTVFPQHGIAMIPCFEGKMNPLKKLTWNKRGKSDEKMRKRFDELTKLIESLDPLDRNDDLEREYRKLFPQIRDHGMKSEVVTRIKELLTRFGIRYLIPGKDGPPMNGEAETMCAHLVLNGLADYVYSTDSDLYVYGVQNLVTKISSTWRKTEGRSIRVWDYTMVDAARILTILNIDDFDVFRDFGILCGTDYNLNIPNIGPARALPLMLKYRSLDKLEVRGQRVDKIEIDGELILAHYPEVRDIFLSALVPTTFLPEEFVVPREIGLARKIREAEESKGDEEDGVPERSEEGKENKEEIPKKSVIARAVIESLDRLSVGDEPKSPSKSPLKEPEESPLLHPKYEEILFEFIKASDTYYDVIDRVITVDLPAEEMVF
jgi:5'-3' exonuclease